MTLNTFVEIVCLIGTVVCWIGYRHLDKNVYLTYKEQTIPPKNTKKKGAKK